MNTFSVINDKGLRFNIVIVEVGDKYGRDNCLTHGQKDHDKYGGDLIEFYDARYPDSIGTGSGQFIGRYYVDTLQKRDSDYGLDLHGGVPDWGLDVAAMSQVHRFIDYNQGQSNDR